MHRGTPLLLLLLSLAFQVVLGAHDFYLAKLNERQGRFKREPRISPMDLYDPLMLEAHTPQPSLHNPKHFQGRLKVGNHLHGSSFLNYKAQFRHHVYNIDLHGSPFEDILCAPDGMYFRTAEGSGERGFELLNARSGHVISSASSWDCTDGIDGVEHQDGPIYRLIQGMPEYISLNGLDSDLTSDVVFVRTTPQLGLMDVIHDGYLKYSFNPPEFPRQSEKRDSVSRTWGMNYDTSTQRASSVVNTTISSPLNGRPNTVTLLCKNCYAYLTVGLDFEFDWGLSAGVKNLKFAATGTAGVEADYEILFDLSNSLTIEYDIAGGVNFGSITFPLGWLPVTITFSGHLIAQLAIKSQFQAVFAHRFSATGYSVLGTQYTKEQGTFRSLNAFPAPSISIERPTFSFQGGTADIRLTLMPTLRAALWGVAPIDVSLKPYVGIEMAYPDLSNCPSTALVGYQSFWGVDVEFRVDPLKFDFHFWTIRTDIGGILPFTKTATITDKRYITCSVCSGCVGSSAAVLLSGNGVVKHVTEPDSYFFYLYNISINETKWPCGSGPAPTCNTYVRTYWCDGIPLSYGNGSLQSNSPNCAMGEASTAKGPSDSPVWNNNVAAFTFPGGHHPNISVWIVVYHNMYTYLSPHNPVLMDAYFVLGGCNGSLCDGEIQFNQPNSPSGTIYFAVGSVPKVSLGMFSDVVNITEKEMSYFQISVPPNVRTWATDLYLKSVSLDDGNADLYINDDTRAPFLPATYLYQQKSVTEGDYETMYINLSPYPAYSGFHNNESVIFAIGVYAYSGVSAKIYGSPYIDLPFSQFTNGLQFKIDHLSINQFWHIDTHWAENSNDQSNLAFDGIALVASGSGGDLGIFVLKHQGSEHNNSGWNSGGATRGADSLIIPKESMWDPQAETYNTDLSLYLYSFDDLPEPYSNEPVTNTTLYSGFFYSVKGMSSFHQIIAKGKLSYLAVTIPLDLSVKEFKTMEIDLAVVSPGPPITYSYYVRPWDSVAEALPTPDKFPEFVYRSQSSRNIVKLSQDAFTTRPELPDKVLIGVWGISDHAGVIVRMTVTPVFETESGKELKALLLFGNQDSYKVRVPLRTDVPGSTVLIEVRNNAGAEVINTYIPLDSIAMLLSDSTPNITLPASKFTTGFVNLNITAPGITSNAVVSTIVTQSLPVFLSDTALTNITGSASADGITVFDITLQNSSVWNLGVYVQVSAIFGDPDLFVSLSDPFVKTSDWSSRRFGDDSMGVMLTEEKRKEETPHIYISVPCAVASSYNITVNPLLPPAAKFYSPDVVPIPPNITAKEVRENGLRLVVTLLNTQYRYVDWVDADFDTTTDITNQLGVASNGSQGWNEVIKPVLLSTNGTISRLDDFNIVITIPPVPTYNPPNDETITFTAIPSSAALPGIGIQVEGTITIAHTPPTIAPTAPPSPPAAAHEHKLEIGIGIGVAAVIAIGALIAAAVTKHRRNVYYQIVVG